MATRKSVTPYTWQFRSRFRRNAFGWRSDIAVKRVHEAVSEIKKVARKDEVLAAEGAILFLEKVSPALEQVDSSSGAIGSAVYHAIAALAEIIASAEVDRKTREGWLERLFRAYEEDKMPYIERLADFWGDLCVTPDLASIWADQLLSATRMALSPDPKTRGFYQGTSVCLSALYTASRYDEIIDLITGREIWEVQEWKFKALAASKGPDDALRYAESCRERGIDHRIDAVCEDLLLASGRMEEAYDAYGLTANRAGTYSTWFRNVAKKYPHKAPGEILHDLVDLTPGEEGKWFATAKSLGLFDEAIALAHGSRCSPQTLTRAARDFVDSRPEFACEAGLAAIRWLCEGYGYDLTPTDIGNAVGYTMVSARNAGRVEAARERIEAYLGKPKTVETWVKQAIRQYVEVF